MTKPRRPSLKGKTFLIKQDAKHHLRQDFAGLPFKVGNWWDRSRRFSPYAMEWSVYGARSALCYKVPLPNDNQVLLGVVAGRYELVHVSELDLKSKPAQESPKTGVPTR